MEGNIRSAPDGTRALEKGLAVGPPPLSALASTALSRARVREDGDVPRWGLLPRTNTPMWFVSRPVAPTTRP
jgi:hypothetical protein